MKSNRRWIPLPRWTDMQYMSCVKNRPKQQNDNMENQDDKIINRLITYIYKEYADTCEIAYKFHCQTHILAPQSIFCALLSLLHFGPSLDYYKKHTPRLLPIFCSLNNTVSGY